MFRRARLETQALINRSQFWSAPKLRELQWEKLLKLLNHAYESCEFYRERFDRIGFHPRKDLLGFECLAKIPILTKSDIQDNLQRLRTTDSTIRGIELNSTGGSTGTPLNFYQDDNYRSWASAARSRAWRQFSDVSPRAIEAVLWGADRDVGRAFSYASLLKNVIRYRTLQLNTFDLDAEKIRRYLKVYNLLRPQILRGYATSLYYVANFIAEHAMHVCQTKVIISSAEMLRPAMRTQITAVFGAKVIDSYGCREVSQIATECSEACGLHLVMENQYVEVVDGQILVTNLNNYAMPFIRYQVGDLAEGIETASCNCGRAAYRLMGLKGRDNENITLPDGRVINGEFFEFLFFGFNNVEQFQVVYARSEQLLLIRMRVKNNAVKVEKMVREKLEQGFGFTNVKFDFTDHFDKTPTGKLRFVYSVDCMEGGVSHAH